MRHRSIYISVFTVSLSLMAAALFFYYNNEEPLDQLIQPEKLAADEDFFADQISIVKYRHTGEVYYRMQATNLSHYETSDIAYVQQPRMSLYTEQGVQWRAVAAEGKVYDHQQAIDLITQVNLLKFENNQPKPTFHLSTQSITLYPETNNVTTSAAVKMKTANITTEAVGMKANLDNSNVTLLHNVKSHYENK